VRLVGLGHEVVVVTTTSAEWLGHGHMRRYEALELPVFAIRRADEQNLTIEYDDPVMTKRFGEILLATRPDVVHFHAMQMLGVGCVAEAQRLGFPTVVTLHDAWWLCERQFMVRGNGSFCGQSWINPDVCATCVPSPGAHRQRQLDSAEILRRCARVLVPSEFWRGLMVGSALPAEKVFVNANGVSRPERGWQRPQHTGPVRFGFVGGIHPVKGHPHIVQAFVSLRRSDYELKVVDGLMNLGGQGFDHEDWDVPGYVQIVPGYDRDTLDDFFGSIDVLLFPSQWKESYGLTVREAMLRGVWPIATDGGGTVEHMIDGVNGTVIPLDGDYRHLAKAINDVLDNPGAFVPRMSDDAPQIATLDQQTRDLEAQLRAVVEGAGASGGAAATGAAGAVAAGASVPTGGEA
jgi:glycosyltransferase involved in cell wall biosynthesis